MDPTSEAWFGAVEAELRRLRPEPSDEGLVSRARQELFGRLPPGYIEETEPAEAAWDCLAALILTTGSSPGRSAPDGVAGLGPGPGRTTLTAARQGAVGFRLRRAGHQRVELSTWLPVLDSFGLVVVEAVPWHFSGTGAQSGLYIDDIGLRLRSGPGAALADVPPGFEASPAGALLIEAVVAVMSGEAEVTPLNSLVVSAGLSWREVSLLTTYCHYRRQVGGPRAVEKADALTGALVMFPAAAAACVELFKALLVSPGKEPGAARQAVEATLARVPGLEDDEALHELAAMIEATTRSTWALGNPVIALKLASTGLSFLPAPRPFAEIYVFSPWFEGIHLRFGPVARGGVRWSDRTSDLRGEVLGLARAQVKKNSLIVPTGAKGVFCLRVPPGTGLPATAPLSTAEAGRAAYSAFVGALLDLTDNVVDGGVVHPPVVCRDGDDPYLVVAADKGTASFSDLANSISTGKGFWLGDAFASGGTNGYDHKALGITAKGAWLAVRRHFRALGMQPDEERLRVVGVGDMSGDVFGNAMLQSRNLLLVAAFDHRHVFVDPTPDPGAAFAERYRLSRLNASSWADYDMAQASAGAAVYPRQAKQVELSAQARAALGITAGALSPPELVRAVLAAPVDLLFFGGIGTFVRGPGENDVDIEDHANDDVRLDAKDLRARVTAEGANLALTQPARAAYSRRGGRVNADFVDNAAGVVLSDREVNMKILLGLGMASGRISLDRRQELLSLGQEEAALSVLAQVEGGIVALDRAAESSPAALPAYEGLLADLETEGLLDRAVEALPSDEELGRRAQAGAGFSRPELAVLVAYARSELARDIEKSALAGNGDLAEMVLAYFPRSFREGLEDLVRQHPLAHQLAASQLANEILEYMGPVWAHESAVETGRGLHEAATAYWVARQLLGAGPVMAQLASRAPQWPLEAEESVRDALAQALARLARWCLLQPGPLRAGAQLHTDLPLVPELAPLLATDEALRAELKGVGAPEDVVDDIVRLTTLSVLGEVGTVARSSGRAPADAVRAMGAAAKALSVGPINRQLVGARPADRWDRRQLHMLADDLARALAATAAAALAAFPAEAGVGAVEAFLRQKAPAVSRLRSLARRVDAPGPANFSLLALCVRALAEISQAQPGEAVGA